MLVANRPNVRPNPTDYTPAPVLTSLPTAGTGGTAAGDVFLPDPLVSPDSQPYASADKEVLSALHHLLLLEA
jgi:hypothetical protein